MTRSIRVPSGMPTARGSGGSPCGAGKARRSWNSQASTTRSRYAATTPMPARNTRVMSQLNPVPAASRRLVFGPVGGGPRPPSVPDPQLLTRARGALLGLVAGNQLGVPTDHLGTAEAIRAAFPQGISDPAPPPKGSPYDDDAALTLLLGESLAEAGDFDAHDVARRWVKWMRLDGRGIGVTTRAALRLVDRGAEPF